MPLTGKHRRDVDREVPRVRGGRSPGSSGGSESRVTNVYAIFDSLPAARIVQRSAAGPPLKLGLPDVSSAAILMACGALRREHAPAILVLDSDSLEERVILQEEVAIEGVMELYRERIPYRIILAVPQVE